MGKYIAILLLFTACSSSKVVVSPTAKKVTTVINGSNSTGINLSYRWRFVQGSGSILNTANKVSPVTFDSKGVRLIELTVTDSYGQSDRDTTRINVNK